MVSLVKCNGSCNVLSPKIHVRKKKYLYFEVLNMITNGNEAKTMTKHISCDCKCKFNSTKCNLTQKWNVHVHVKIIVHVKKIIVGILAHLFVTMTRA